MMTNVMEAQQELISRLATACARERRVPDQGWLSSTLCAGGAEELVSLLQAVYPYASGFDELPEAQKDLLLERVRTEAPGARRASPRSPGRPRRHASVG